MLLSEFINLQEKPGCNMTESGRACAVHGLNECPGYKMIEDSAREKLHKRHQELRKKSGLPNPDYYKELKATFDLPDEERLARVKEIKKKYNVNEGGPFRSTEPKKPRKGSVADLAAKKRQEQERGKQPAEPRDHMVGVARVKKDVAEGRGNIEALRTELMGEYLNIYYNALDGWNMTDHIINLQDVYGRVKRSRDPVLQQTYNLLMDHAEESIDVQASAALKAIRILGDEPNYTPPPRPPMSPEDSARADAFVNQFLAALVSHGIKTHPDWQKNNDKGVAEGRKPDYNFDIEDIKKLEQVRDLETLKTLALQLISKPSAKPMKPEKVEWFKSALERMDSPLKVIKLMYDLLLSGEGHSVIGSRKSMNPNTYRQRFGEDKVTNEDVEKYLEEMQRAGYEVLHEESHSCPECGGPAFSDQVLAEKQDACYHKVKSRYKVWPSAYASGALVRCRKVGAKNWGNKSKK